MWLKNTKNQLQMLLLLIIITIFTNNIEAVVSSSSKINLESKLDTKFDIDNSTNTDFAGEDEDDLIITSNYVLPNQIFNDGKPYYASKDPISGQPDFSLKKSAGIVPNSNEILNPNEKGIIQGANLPNIHDFLNLPVKYSSSKFLYPLMSSSYANLKYQGNNKNFATNKKTPQVMQITTDPKLHTISPRLNITISTPPTTTSTTTIVTTTTTTNTEPPIKHHKLNEFNLEMANQKSSTSVPYQALSTKKVNNLEHSKISKPLTMTRTNNKTTVTAVKNETHSSTTLSPTQTTNFNENITETRKKSTSTKKYTLSGNHLTVKNTIKGQYSTSKTTKNSLLETKQSLLSTTTKNHIVSATTPTTQQLNSGGSQFPYIEKEQITTTTQRSRNTTTNRSNVNNKKYSIFDPMFSTSSKKNFLATEENHQQHQYYNQKKSAEKQDKNSSTSSSNSMQDTLSISTIINTLVEEKPMQEVTKNEQNIMNVAIKPMSSSRPTPFSMHNNSKTTLNKVIESFSSEKPSKLSEMSTNPNTNRLLLESNGSANPASSTNVLLTPSSSLQPLGFNKVSSNSHSQIPSSTFSQFVAQHPGGTTNNNQMEGYNNEYVSYQVQQPNLMQYRPSPGNVNKVIISPSQNSASFVLGSQQQVGTNSFGSVQESTVYLSQNNNVPVQYGTVINEDIATLKREKLPSTLINSQRPASNSALTIGHRENMPPSVINYQQLPILGSHLTKNKIKIPSLHTLKKHPFSTISIFGSDLSSKPIRENGVLIGEAGISEKNLHYNNKQNTSRNNNHLSMSTSQNTKDLLASTNIHFPTTSEEHSTDSSPSVPPINLPSIHLNGVTQPLSLQQIQNANPVIFPKTSIDETFVPPMSDKNVQIQQHEVLTMSQHQQKLKFSSKQPAHDTPIQHMVPPMPFHHNTVPPNIPSNSLIGETELPKLHRPSLHNSLINGPPAMIPLPPLSSHNLNFNTNNNNNNENYNTQKVMEENDARPLNRSNNPERHLPNILPQFRPNAKISHEHSPSHLHYHSEPGIIHVTMSQSSSSNVPRPHNYPTSLQFSHRRQPFVQQKRYLMNRSGSDASMGINRRIHRIQVNQFSNGSVPPRGRLTTQHLPRPLSSGHMNSGGTERLPLLGGQNELLSAFEENDLIVKEVPQTIRAGTSASEYQPHIYNELKLEPVVTLQMLQQQSQQKAMMVTSAKAQTESKAREAATISSNENSVKKDGIYMVFPQKITNDKQNTTLVTLAHIEPSTEVGYHNAAFTVQREQYQEPILKNKKAISGLTAVTSTSTIVYDIADNNTFEISDKFPYRLEKPDSYSNKVQAEYIANSKIYPKIPLTDQIIKLTYGRGTQTPIAIAYTPTNPSKINMQLSDNVTYASKSGNSESSISERQTEKSFDLSDHDYELERRNYEKDFMAPFYPSVSLNSVTDIPISNGWNILDSTELALHDIEKNNIDRADTNASNLDVINKRVEYIDKNGSVGSDNFQPELQGGFKPIYPPNYFNDYNQSSENTRKSEKSINSNNVVVSSTAENTNTIKKREQEEQHLLHEHRVKNVSIALPLKIENYDVNVGNKIHQNITFRTTKTPNSEAVHKKKVATDISEFQTSLAALLFGNDEEEDNIDKKKEINIKQQDEQEVNTVNKRNVKKKIKETLLIPERALLSGPRSVVGPRSL